MEIKKTPTEHIEDFFLDVDNIKEPFKPIVDVGQIMMKMELEAFKRILFVRCWTCKTFVPVGEAYLSPIKPVINTNYEGGIATITGMPPTAECFNCAQNPITKTDNDGE